MSRDRVVPERDFRHAASRRIGGMLLTCACALAGGIDVARADPPSVDTGTNATATSPAPADASPPTIAVVTLQTATQEGASGVVAVDPDTGIRFEDLPREIGVRVRVTTLGQRVHRGVIRAADAHRLTLSTSQHGGSAVYVLSREQVQRIDPD